MDSEQPLARLAKHVDVFDFCHTFFGLGDVSCLVDHLASDLVTVSCPVCGGVLVAERDLMCTERTHTDKREIRCPKTEYCTTTTEDLEYEGRTRVSKTAATSKISGYPAHDHY